MRFLTYFGISAICLAIDYSLFLALDATGTPAVAAGSAGYIAGLLAHYAISRRRLFSPVARNSTHVASLAQYTVTGLIGTAITAMVVWYAMTLDFSAPQAKGLAAAVSFGCVYLIRSRLFFHEPPKLTRT